MRFVVPLGAGHDDHDDDNEDGADVDTAMGDACASSSSGTHKH